MISKKALLVLDMAEVYVYGDKPLIPEDIRDKIIENIKKAIRGAHKNNISVIYITSAFRKDDPIYSMYINYRDQAMEGAKNSQTIRQLSPQLEDYILFKRGYDAFWKSGLENLLNKLGVKELYLTGCQTDCCVRETAVTAAHLGYEVYILEDCCQTNREFGQVAAIRFLTSCTRGIISVKDLKW